MSDPVKVVLVQSYEWEALYAEGKLKYEGHGISVREFGEIVQALNSPITFQVIRDHSKYLWKHGQYPSTLVELNGWIDD